MGAPEWEFVQRPPHARLGGLVLRYEGYAIAASQRMQRRDFRVRHCRW